MLRRRRGAVALGIVLAGMLLAGRPCAFALNPALDVSQYAHTAWKVSEGFFKGVIASYSIAQTPDGYLWLGTEFGLLRFDGVRFSPVAVARRSTSPQQQHSKPAYGARWNSLDRHCRRAFQLEGRQTD